MPSMFSSRRKGTTNPPVDPNTLKSATVAASSAFLQRPTSSASLSSAAAAAALRSQTTTPEPIGSIQTKRMVRRGSTSSVGSGSVTGRGTRDGGGRGLQRTNSGGSMSERTFRSPSPGSRQTNGAQGPSSPLTEDVPPVPALPQGVGQHKRASSMEPAPRIMSPTPPTGKRGSSVDRASMPPPAKHKPRLSDVNEAEDRSPTTALRNFSRPMSPPQNSSPTTSSAPKKHTHGMGGWHTTASGAAVPSKTTATPPPPQRGGVAPLNKLVKKNRSSSAAGSHLSQANRASVTSLDSSRDEAESVMIYDPNTRTFVQQTRRQANSGPDIPAQSRSKEVYDPNTRSFVSRPVASGSTARAPEVKSSTPSQPQPQPQSRKPRPELTPVETKVEPPPKNPARYSPSLSPSSPRAMGFLQKQPSIVREDREGEEEAEAAGPVVTRNDTGRLLSLRGPPKSYQAPASSHQRSSSLDIPRSDADGSGRGRNTSISPQRSAHFSPSPVIAAARHIPPPRDISPAKSALKQSPASSIRNSSPMATFAAVPGYVKAPASEVSDTSDLASQDGLTPLGGKKKKSVRVSFDEQPHQIETANTIAASNAAANAGEDDALMKPRPALPSFGSVRRDRAEKVTEMPPERHDVSSDHAIGGILASSLKTDAPATQAEPLPPEVTSKESAGYISDASSEADVPVAIPTVEPKTTAAPLDETNVAEDADVPEIQLLPPTPGLDEETKKELHAVAVDDVDIGARKRNSMERISVPGGWGLDEESAEEKPVAVAVPHDSQPRVNAEPPQQSVAPVPAADQTSTATVTQGLSDVGEHDSDDSAEFSDAAEDPSEFDIGGFASLDAIVESPMVTPSRGQTSAKDVPASPESPLDNHAETGDWTSATAYWSQLSRAQREQIESEDAKQIVAVKQPKMKKPNVSAAQRPTSSGEMQKPLQSAMKKSMRAQPGPAPVDDGVHMRRSMRDGGRTQRPQSAHIENRGALQKKTMRPMSMGGMPASAGATAPRPQSTASLQSQSSALPPVSTKAPASRPAQKSDMPQVSLRLQRELSKADDSDSESSFKKSRRRTNSMSTMDSQGRFNMKRSMRDAPPVPEQPRPALRERRTSSPTPVGKDKGGFRLRSLSPFGRSKKPSVRESLAASPASASGGRTTLRGTPAAAGRAKLAAKPAAAPVSAPKPSRLTSRFVDSDDEDESARPQRTFRSRFADSDEEDEPSSPMPTGLRPVRGIPRPQGRYDGDSTDLEDEDEDNTGRKSTRQREKQPMPLVPAPGDVEKAMAAARKNLGISAPAAASVQDPENKEGGALHKGSLRQSAPNPPEQQPKVQDVAIASPERKKRGFMGSILRRNRNSSASVQQVGSPRTEYPPSPAIATPSSVQPANIEGVNVTPSSPSTPSRGKLVRRSSQQPQPSPQPPAPLLRGDSTFSTATAPPNLNAKPPLDGHWPLPPPVPSLNGTTAVSGETTTPTDAEADADAKRPNTSDGNPVRLASTMRRPSSQRVRIDAGEEGSEPGEREPAATVYSRRTGKKKKFGLLRKAFGLDD